MGAYAKSWPKETERTGPIPKNNLSAPPRQGYTYDVNPTLYQINARAFLQRIGPAATLHDIPDDFIDYLAEAGFHWLWLMGVWSLGDSSRSVSRTRLDWREEFIRALPDLVESDICGSPFAVCSYTIDPAIGSRSALAYFRQRLRQRGIKLLLDFVPNHVGLDHAWIIARPDFFFHGSEEQLAQAPDRWVRVHSGEVLALGRDPYFPGWPDTLQLNYFNEDLHTAMREELLSIAQQCDGVRCDMAMLLEPEVFSRTWGEFNPRPGQPSQPFWERAVKETKRSHPNFTLMAEVYWDYEHTLQQHGFDYTYDKRLYDRIVARDPRGIREHLSAPLAYQSRMVHFLENHDEPRIASVLSRDEHRAAAVLTFFTPGLRFFHDGEFRGARIKLPVHLKRTPCEEAEPEIEALYRKLLPVCHSNVATLGTWELLSCSSAWEGNPTSSNFVGYLLEHQGKSLLTIVNYADHQGQCYLLLPPREWLRGEIVLQDHLSETRYSRGAHELAAKGLYLDMPAWGAHLFEVEAG